MKFARAAARGFYSRDVKSPSGRVNVAWAGERTKVSAVRLTLPEMAAMGSATINTAEPNSVATKQPGRTSAMSVMVAMSSSLRPAQADVAHADGDGA